MDVLSEGWLCAAGAGIEGRSAGAARRRSARVSGEGEGETRRDGTGQRRSNDGGGGGGVEGFEGGGRHKTQARMKDGRGTKGRARCEMKEATKGKSVDGPGQGTTWDPGNWDPAAVASAVTRLRW